MWRFDINFMYHIVIKNAFVNVTFLPMEKQYVVLRTEFKNLKQIVELVI